MVKQQIEKTPFFDDITLELLEKERRAVDLFASKALANIVNGEIDSDEVKWLSAASARAQEETAKFADGQLRMFSARCLFEHPDGTGTQPLKYVDPEDYMYTEIQVCGVFQGVHVVAAEAPQDGSLVNKFILVAEIKAYIAGGAEISPDKPEPLYLPYQSLKIIDAEPEKYFPGFVVEQMRDRLLIEKVSRN